jgi:hypothetical protein
MIERLALANGEAPRRSRLGGLSRSSRGRWPHTYGATQGRFRQAARLADRTLMPAVRALCPFNSEDFVTLRAPGVATSNFGTFLRSCRRAQPLTAISIDPLPNGPRADAYGFRDGLRRLRLQPAVQSTLDHAASGGHSYARSSGSSLESEVLATSASSVRAGWATY